MGKITINKIKYRPDNEVNIYFKIEGIWYRQYPGSFEEVSFGDCPNELTIKLDKMI